jgi:hypothetical protein
MKNKKLYFSKLLLILSLVFLITGCQAVNDLNNLTDDLSDLGDNLEDLADLGGIGGDKSGGLSGEDAKASKKIDFYIECVNNFSQRAFASHDYYLTNIDPAVGPVGGEPHIGIHTFPLELSRCTDAIKNAKNIDAEEQLNEPADAYAVALEELAPLLEEADKYYSQEDFKDDNYAKGKELHPKLMDAFDKFEAADTALKEKMDVVQKRLTEERLKAMEESGDKLGYLHTKLMKEAEELVTLGSVPTYTDVDLDTYNPALDAYEATLNELNTYATANKDEMSGLTNFSFFQSAADDFLTSAKQLMRRKRDNTPYDTGEQMLGGDNSEMVDGSPADVVDTYNDLVDQSNSMIKFGF